MSKFGVCHLCCSNGKLSFEHIPPEAAFNDQRVLESDIHALICCAPSPIYGPICQPSRRAV